MTMMLLIVGVSEEIWLRIEQRPDMTQPWKINKIKIYKCICSSYFSACPFSSSFCKWGPAGRATFFVHFYQEGE
jgi:hypothetical protein